MFYSPHYYEDAEYEERQHRTTIDQIMFDTRMFDVDGEGSDWVPEPEPDNTFVLSLHKQFSGFWSNDVQIQLRQRGIDTLVLAGMSTNLRVESHLRDAVENVFEVLTVTDATAAAGEEALQAALTNFTFIAHETVTTDELVPRLANAATAATPANDCYSSHRLLQIGDGTPVYAHPSGTATDSPSRIPIGAGPGVSVPRT